MKVSLVWVELVDREFSAAHDQLNEQLAEAGLDRMGRTMGRGAQRPGDD